MAGFRRLLCSCVFSALAFLMPAVVAQQANRAVAGDAAIAHIASPKLPTVRSTESPPVPVPPEPPRLPPIAPGAGLRHLVSSAGMIFSGRVVSIGRGGRFDKDRAHSDSFAGPNAASTEITFLVEHALRGTVTGQRLTIHEWAGKRGTGAEQAKSYYVGERLMLFLYSPSQLGLTSLVAGNAGRFAVDPQGRIVLSELHRRIFADDPLFVGREVIAYGEIEQAVRRIGLDERGGHE